MPTYVSDAFAGSVEHWVGIRILGEVIFIGAWVTWLKGGWGVW